jgi:carbon starvation protein
MLLEGLVAVVALSCVMMLARTDRAVAQGPNLIFGMGMSRFLEVLGIPAAFGISFGLLAFATFVYDTLDVSTRLGRYVLQELTGWHTAAGRWCATAVTVLVPLAFVMQRSSDASGKAVPAWKVFWGLFGASNQLLAALALIAITVWLARTRKARWVWFVTGLPAAWMYVMSAWALLKLIARGFFTPAGEFKGFVPDAATAVAVVVMALALLLMVETLRVLAKMRRPAAPTAG